MLSLVGMTACQVVCLGQVNLFEGMVQLDMVTAEDRLSRVCGCQLALEDVLAMAGMMVDVY